MKCYLCLTDSVVDRKNYFDLLTVTLISACRNTSLRLICLYDGKVNDPVYNLLVKYNVEVIIHEWPYKKEIQEIYPAQWMIENLGQVIDYSRLYGTFLRMEIPFVETEDEYVFYSDIDVIFNGDITLDDLPRPAYLAAAPEFERDPSKIKHFNAGVLMMNIKGMREKGMKFRQMMKDRERNQSGLFDQGYLNELCFADMTPLPVEYNWKPYWGFNPDAKLIHFHGMKPSSSVTESGFDTKDTFFRTVFGQNPKGYAGYVHYLDIFFDYLGLKQNTWTYEHLQYIFDLYQAPTFTYERKCRKYQRISLLMFLLSVLFLIISIVLTVLLFTR